MDPKHFEDLTQRLKAVLPPGLNALGRDTEQALRAALEAAIRRMELVTREEFDIQHAVLQRTREKLVALEARVEALENRNPSQESVQKNSG